MPAANDAPPDLPALTSLRFFAATMIFLYHQRGGAPTDALHSLSPGLYQGVSFFFVLSGFVLTYAHAGRNVLWRAFYRARVARIAPLHLAALALALAALPPSLAVGQNLGTGPALAALALKATLLDGWAPIHGWVYAWNSVSWSLSVEMGLYAAFPLLLAAMLRRPFVALAAAGAVSASVLFAGAALGLPLLTTDPDALTQVDLGSCFPPARLFEFALGMATCLTWRRWAAPARLSRAAWTALEAAALSGVAAWLILGAPALVGETHGAAFVLARSAGSCWAFALLLAAMAGGRGRLGSLLATRPLVALGQASFAFYLVHLTVLRAVELHFGARPFNAPAFLLALALAFVLHHSVEIPMRRRVLGWGGTPKPTGVAVLSR